MENKIANPGPLGLLGFGMTTVLLNIHNMGFFPVDAVIIAMGIFFGGISQIIAGILDFKRNNLFGGTAFVAYGFFWITLVAIWLLPEFGAAKAAAPDSKFFGCYLILWGLFSLLMFIGTKNMNNVMRFVFFSLVFLFFFLIMHSFTGAHIWGTIAGVTGIVCGMSAFYLAMAELLGEVLGKKILPY